MEPSAGLPFNFSESSYGHWLPLLLADRVQVIEGLVEDLRAGHLPNLAAEKGLGAELKYNKKSLIIRAAGGAFVLAALIGYYAVKKPTIKS